MADVIDPDIVEPVRKDWEESGVSSSSASG